MSIAIVHNRQALQLVINLKVFIKLHSASHFGLYIKNELKFNVFLVLLIYLFY